MYNSNSLGIGTSGNTYNLIPNNLRIPNNIIYGHNKNSLINNNQNLNKPVKSQNKISIENFTTNSTDNSTTNSTDNSTDNYTINRISSENNVIENKLKQEVTLEGEMNKEDILSNISNKNQIPKQSTQKQVINYYQEAFRNIASNQLYGAFRKVKGITSNSEYFRDTKLAYINYEAMQYLINKARQENYNKGVMSLKTYLVNENQKSVDPLQLNDILELIKIMEILGPPDHAIIALNDSQIHHLKQNQFNEVFWPNGANGITWLNKAQNDKTNW
jgi:hypothetical protein